MRFEDIARLQQLDKKLKKLDFKRRVLEVERDDLRKSCDHVEGDGEASMGSAWQRHPTVDVLHVCTICGAEEA